MTIVLDAGAFIAFERGDRKLAALVEAARRHQDEVRTSSGCVAQAWRVGRTQALLARLLSGVEEVALGPTASRAVGELCGRAGVADVIDAHLALLAQPGDVVVTSDPTDAGSLLRTRGTAATIVAC